MIDSLIATKVILKCKKESVKVFSVHDCFYVNKKHSEFINNAYYDSIIDIMFSPTGNPLLNLINENASYMSKKKYHVLE